MDTLDDANIKELSFDTFYVPRSRLNHILAQACCRKLVYVIAGAGYGKTQAVRHYVEQQDAAVWWMQLTENDNETFSFWENLVHTISIDNPELAVELRELGFPKTQICFRRFTEIMRAAEYRLRKLFLVVDDFHLIHSKEVLLFVERCAYMKIPSVCLVLLSRKEPEINAVSLLAKGNISMITEDELRFTVAEAAEFLRRHEIFLSTQEVSQLIDVTKGWALAINLFHLMIKRTPNNFKYAIDAMTQNILKLMEIEAWNNFSENVQKTVVKLSLLSDLPAVPLLEISGDVKFLQNTSGLASFIWFNSFSNDFRIHPLYLAFLQSKHYIVSYEEKQETYQWAAQWCCKNDFYMDAMRCYAKAHQFERMIKIFLSYPFKLPRDASEYFLKILEELGSSAEEQNDPNVIFLKNYFIPLLLIGAGRYEEARERTWTVIREWESINSPFSFMLLYTSYSNLAYIDMYFCTFTHKYNTPEYLRKSVEYFKRSSIPPAEVTGSFINADIRSFACLVGEGADLSEFEQFLKAARQTALYTGETEYNIYAGYDDLVACEYAFFKNQPDLARQYAHNAILKAREKKQYSIVAMAEKYLLRIATQEGNASLVKEILKQLRAHLNNPDFRNRQMYYDLYTGSFYAQIGLLEMVPDWFVMNEREMISEVRFPARELFVLALYCIASKKYHQALTLLCHSYPREPQERFLFGELRLVLLSAIARVKTDDIAGAMSDFEKAYHLSFQGVFEVPFIELGKELRPLVAMALKQTNCSIPEEWLKMISRKASIYVKKVGVVVSALKAEANITEAVSLSKREREVLIDLYHGLSREEIAANQYISVHTVKKILESIYIKLDAKNNVDAIRSALEKKLIE